MNLKGVKDCKRANSPGFLLFLMVKIEKLNYGKSHVNFFHQVSPLWWQHMY